MEWDSNSSSSSDIDSKSPFTPTEGVSHVSVEELTNAVGRMRELCLTPKLERSERRSASRLPDGKPSGVKRRVLFPRKEQEHLKWLD